MGRNQVERSIQYISKHYVKLQFNMYRISCKMIVREIEVK